MFAFMVSYGMQSPGCAMVGQAVGACDIGRAKAYFWAAIVVFLAILVIEINVFYYFKDDIIQTMTKFEDLKECITSVYPLFLLNIVFAGLNGTLRGPIYALGLMKQLTKFNLIFQGLMMPALSYYFTQKHALGMNGIWLSKNIVELSLLVSYSIKLSYIDWHGIAHQFMKTRMMESCEVARGATANESVGTD